jgi:hypothetical protein
MARPALPLGSYGKITVWQDGKAFVARTKFRDFDGVVPLVKRTGKTRAAAERALKTALVERQAPVARTQLSGASLFANAAELARPRSSSRASCGSPSGMAPRRSTRCVRSSGSTARRSGVLDL